MIYIRTTFLLLIFLITAFHAHAILAPFHKEQDEKVVVKKQKLKFKEKVALWALRRKLKKNNDENQAILVTNETKEWNTSCLGRMILLLVIKIILAITIGFLFLIWLLNRVRRENH